MAKPTKLRQPFTGQIPDGPITMRLASRILGKEPYGVLVLIATGEIEGQKVLNAAGEARVQVMGASVRAYQARQAAMAAATAESAVERAS